MSLHDQQCPAVLGHAGHPGHQQIVEHCLADPYRRVRPDVTEPDVSGYRIGSADPDVVAAQSPGIAGAQVARSLVDVDGPDGGVGRPTCHHERDRSGTAAKVENLVARSVVDGSTPAQQQFGPGIESTVTEDPAVGLDLDVDIPQIQVHPAGCRRCARSGVEIVGRRNGVVRGGIAAGHLVASLADMARDIRTFGDPVLTAPAAEVIDIDAKVARLVDEMFDTLYTCGNGIGLAAPQIGVRKKVFVWDLGDEPMAIVNPRIVDSRGEWVYDEGCLSIPGLYVEMVRPAEVLMTGWTLDGDEVEIEADELLGRLFQHELDHLEGVLMFDRMTPDQRREALADYRRLQEQPAVEPRAPRRLRLR